MTESEWLRCANPKVMRTFLRTYDKPSPRKARLLACACVRRVHHLLIDERSRSAVDVAEQLAEGIVDGATARAAAKGAKEAYESQQGKEGLAAIAAELTLGRYPVARALDYAAWAVRHSHEGEEREAETRERGEQARLLRDLFGNPFRPVTFDPAWRTPVGTSLAQAAYDERILPSGELDAQRLAVMADALEEAGCDNAEILVHLRALRSHVRGCWVVDLILGKS